VIAPDPTFVMFRAYAMHAGVRYVAVPLAGDFQVDERAMLAAIERERPALVWLASPNNPTGRAVPVGTIERIVAATPGVVAVDEAYADLRRGYARAARHGVPHLVVLRTLSKIGFAGARLGYAIGHPAWIAEMDKVRSPYNINALTQAVVPALLAAADVFARRSRRCAASGRARRRARCRPRLRGLPEPGELPARARAGRAACGRGAACRGRAGQNLHGHHPFTTHCLRITVGTPARTTPSSRARARP